MKRTNHQARSHQEDDPLKPLMTFLVIREVCQVWIVADPDWEMKMSSLANLEEVMMNDMA